MRHTECVNKCETKNGEKITSKVRTKNGMRLTAPGEGQLRQGRTIKHYPSGQVVGEQVD